MKELIKLTREKRVNIIIQCTSFFLTINKLKSSKKIFTKLKLELDLPAKYDKEIWMAVTMVGKAMRSGCTGSQIPMKSSTYSRANKEHKLGLNDKRARTVILKLESLGYLDFYKGFRDFKADTSIMSCVIFKSKLTDLFPETLVKMYSRSVTTDEMIEVKDEKGNVYTKLTRFKGVNSNRKFMSNYNSCLSSHDIRLGTIKCFVAYKQIFSVDLDGAGRIYSFGGFQTMEAALRKKITIDGEMVTESDVKANHISIMYLLAGIKLKEDFDCYNIYLPEHEYKNIRSLCKYGVMCIINCSNKIAAVFALQKIVREDKSNKNSRFEMFPSDNTSFYKEVITKLLTKHSKLRFFNKDEVLWRKLQRLDSRVSEFVINFFTNLDVPVLGWHDSWVVGRQWSETLNSIIREGWYSVFGTYDNCFVRVEY